MVTTGLPQRPTAADVTSAVSLAVRAPSIHNTQPWRWVSAPRGLELHADRDRRLPVLDPDGRGLMVSCGAALYLAWLGFAAQGWQASVERFPAGPAGDLLARITPTTQGPVDPHLRVLAEAAARRRTDRRPFQAEPVPANLLDELRRRVESPDMYAYLVRRADEQLDLAVVVSWADQLELDDPAYRAELARWVRPDAAAARHGVPVSAVPQLAAGQQRHTTVPLRDFEIGHAGGQPMTAGVDERPAWLVVFTTQDDAVARLRAGEAYARLAVEAEQMGLASSPATQALDLPAVRSRIRALLNWADHPQMIMRVGRPAPGEPAPLTPRLAVEQVLSFRETD
jgi:nitroreductase